MSCSERSNHLLTIHTSHVHRLIFSPLSYLFHHFDLVSFISCIDLLMAWFHSTILSLISSHLIVQCGYDPAGGLCFSFLFVSSSVIRLLYSLLLSWDVILLGLND